jgi:hypothetical protein
MSEYNFAREIFRSAKTCFTVNSSSTIFG